jgi:glycosyltransferase involved in cell wall biosynthesis
MKKRLALIVISLDECFTDKGFSGGGHKVTKHLILGLVESGKFEIDIFCNGKGERGKEKLSLRGVCEADDAAIQKENIIEGINSITLLNKKTFVKDLREKIESGNYDYVLSSDILLPFANNLVHSNSSKYKSKNGKNKLMQTVLKLYNAKKIKAQEKCLENNNNALFTVSGRLKKDYVQNFNIDENKVFVAYPGMEDFSEFVTPEFKDVFTIGSIAGGGLNKGGYLLLLALTMLPKNCNLKARIIFPKFHESFFFKFCIKLLGLESRIELLRKQRNMDEYYKSIDCYVLPSLNEAFGLVVPEAAMNFKPSIVSSTTGVAELIQDRENGFIFDRAKKPVRNLALKLEEVADMYFNNMDKYCEISKNAHEIPTKLEWKKFSDTIINNMVLYSK